MSRIVKINEKPPEIMIAPIQNTKNPKYVAITAGMTAARVLPTSNSQVEIGVANNGSKL